MKRSNHKRRFIEKAGRNYSACSPDLPGCIATGATRRMAEKNMVEAINLHLTGLREDHETIPSCRATAEYVVIK